MLDSKEAIFESVCPYKLCTTSDPTVTSSNSDNEIHCTELPELDTSTSNDNSHNLFLFGDHDYILHSVTKEMHFNWKIKLDSAIGVCPFIGDLNLPPQGKLAVCCCCTVNGSVFIVDVCTGRILSTTKLPGEIFSSPLIFGNRIVIGCRDNNVYCLKIIANNQ